MEIAIVGPDAPDLCQRSSVSAQALFSLRDAAKREWDLLALTRLTERVPLSAPLRTRSLLLPGDRGAAFASAVRTLQVVGYGFSPRDTLTLSSVTGAERLLCIQRSLLALGGVLLEPQDLPLPAAFSALSAEHALLLAGLRLLCE